MLMYLLSDPFPSVVRYPSMYLVSSRWFKFLSRSLSLLHFFVKMRRSNKKYVSSEEWWDEILFGEKWEENNFKRWRQGKKNEPSLKKDIHSRRDIIWDGYQNNKITFVIWTLDFGEIRILRHFHTIEAISIALANCVGLANVVTLFSYFPTLPMRLQLYGSLYLPSASIIHHLKFHRPFPSCFTRSIHLRTTDWFESIVHTILW